MKVPSVVESLCDLNQPCVQEVKCESEVLEFCFSICFQRSWFIHDFSDHAFAWSITAVDYLVETVHHETYVDEAEFKIR